MHQRGAYIVDIAIRIACSEPPARKTRHKIVKLRPLWTILICVWNGEIIPTEIKAMDYTCGRSMLRNHIQPDDAKDTRLDPVSFASVYPAG